MIEIIDDRLSGASILNIKKLILFEILSHGNHILDKFLDSKDGLVNLVCEKNNHEKSKSYVPAELKKKDSFLRILTAFFFCSVTLGVVYFLLRVSEKPFRSITYALVIFIIIILLSQRLLSNISLHIKTKYYR